MHRALLIAERLDPLIAIEFERVLAGRQRRPGVARIVADVDLAADEAVRRVAF